MTFIVAGYGKFGRLSVARLLRELVSPSITVVEKDAARLALGSPEGVQCVHGDAVEFLLRAGSIQPEDLILPMVPFHLAAEFVQARLTGAVRIPLPPGLSSLLPNPFIVNDSCLCCSRADFLCPDDCPEGDLCTVTGLPRDPLYRELENLLVPGVNIVVLRSVQILPGVGGYSFAELQRVTDRVRFGPNSLVTSCKCHSVLTAIEIA